MVTRFIDALDASNNVVATYTETNDAITRWDLPTIFPGLTGGQTYNFVMRTPETAGYTAPILYVLDQIGAVVALRAYSLRLLRGAYGITSPCIDVLRSPDNLVATISFKLYAPRATPYWLDEDALLAHVGSGNGFVTRWYDQSGNARHIEPGSANGRPKIVLSGVIQRLNGMPAIQFDGTAGGDLADNLTDLNPSLFSSGAMTALIVNDLSTAVTSGGLFGERGAGSARYFFASNNTVLGRTQINAANDAGTFFINFQTVGDGIVNGTAKVLTFRDTGSQISTFVNGPRVGNFVNYTRSGTLTLNRFFLGAGFNSGMTDPAASGKIAEALFFGSAISNENMATVTVSQGEAYGITVTPFLTDVERLGIINGPADNGPSMGINFSQIADWEEPIFIDRAKQARGWERPSGGGTPAINLNSEGALASLPGGDTTQNYFFSSFRDGAGVHVDPQPSRGGRFRATITGGASAMTGFGISNITQINPTTWEFDCDWIGNKWLTFTPTAFPIKVSIVRTDLVSAHAGGAIFDPDWLADLPSNGCIRFMDWMLTNNSTVVSLADYPVEASQRWRRVPLSVMVALCNAKNLDPWICIPHAADDTFITNWATYLRDNLNTARKIRVEYSNEIWNTGMFSVGVYLKGLAETVWGVPDGYGGGGFWMDYGGKKFAQSMAIFNSVFAGQTSRLIGVIGGQAANPGLSQRVLDATAWQTYEPGSYVAPRTRAREYAIADYVGWLDGAAATTQGNTIKAALDISHAAAVQAIKDQFAPGLALTQTGINNAVLLAANRNLRLVSYEYGNHFDLNTPAIVSSNLWSGGAPVPGALNALVEATYSQEMANTMDALRNYWKAQNGTLKCQYFYMARGGISGTWGARTHRGHNSAIWNALLAWWAANPRNWTQ